MTTENSAIQRFAQVAHDHGSLEAISDSRTSITYAELNTSSSQTAGALISRGIRPGDRVGLFFNSEPAALAALLGTLKSGAVAVPLLAEHPAERLQQIVNDAEVNVLLTERGQLAVTRALGVAVLSVGETASPPVELPILEADSPAIILYTSGSTGHPKGVLTTHGLLFKKYARSNAVLQISPGDRLTYFSSIALGQGVNTMMQAFLSGATLCPFAIRRDGLARLTRCMEDGRLTVYGSSATLLRNFMRNVGEEARFPAVRIVRVSGERVLPSDIVAARRVFPAARVIVSYACTEAGPIAMHVTNREETFPGGVVPIGRPLEGVAVHILDQDGRAVPPRDAGEITVQSRDIAAGYWRDPERSAHVFSDLADEAGLRLYRTGDLGRWRPDGLLEHLGRKDLRVKIRGFRIEIEEIETVLNQHPDVVRAAVAAKPGPDEDLRLVAYIQLAPESDAVTETLRAQIGQRLPEHMIPSTFVFVDEIPLTESGKIARAHLPDPPAQRPALATQCVLPRTALEGTIASVWREILGLETVGVHDAFLSIGGDSLKATLVASRLASRIGKELPLVMLFEAETISELAAAIEQHPREGGA